MSGVQDSATLLQNDQVIELETSKLFYTHNLAYCLLLAIP